MGEAIKPAKENFQFTILTTQELRGFILLMSYI